jgi:predicted short-subunit dehydrogenase-like oxidoreductase (DUF2520 family)
MVESPLDLAALGRVGFIGAGAAGSALAAVLAARGARVVAVASRHAQRAEALTERLPPGARAMPTEQVPATSDLVILAVADDALPVLAAELPWRPGQGVVHLSGARSADILSAVRERGALPAALHPLMTFPVPEHGTSAETLLARIAGCVWALDAADVALRSSLESLIAALDGRVIWLRPEDRVPYHIAAVFASNYVVALLGAAAELWGTFGESSETAVAALLPLLRAAADQTAAAGPVQALTGPIARGDTSTLEAHLTWLDAHATDTHLAPIRDAYRALARLALPLAAAKGTHPPEAAARIKSLLGDVTPERDADRH